MIEPYRLWEPEHETVVIAAPLLDPKILRKILVLHRDDFGTDKHRIVFDAYNNMAAEGAPVDLFGLIAELDKTGKLTEAGGREYISYLLDSIFTARGLEYHIEQLIEARNKRSIVSVMTRVSTDLRAGASACDLISNVKTALIAINNRTQRIETVSSAHVAAQAVKRLEAMERTDGIPGIPSGFLDIDAHTGGWKGGELIILAGRPGMGKSLLAQMFAENSGVGTAYFSLEMSCDELALRQISRYSRSPYQRIKSGRIGDRWESVIAAAGQISQLPITYIDSASVSINDIVSISENLKIELGIGMVVIDYLQLVKPAERSQSRELEVSGISRQLKCLARELGIPVICLAQLNRQCEIRKPPRPILSDLRESGSIEQDADVVAFLFRPYVYNQGADPGEAECIIGKGRNIDTGIIPMVFDGAHQVFRNAVREG